ncbi:MULTISPECIES: hypothetical protein [unclassified Mesorhizobium]|uniref:hypothetical protein n=1 Tax=unclassified Mesorhizobium TaxID=325217 RepID=UPI000FE47D3F|nr:MULTISPECIES: hypothetical protein [unclassified Mesorhizobium]RWB98669.1 MAG: hypothetical protein EOQ57_20855 [Mesorhizobium sp.]TGV21923.1 hypothetical protein EN786_31945 [Mesorhizobium sp. M4B.F.Ca.ET.143.01.1.1]
MSATITAEGEGGADNPDDDVLSLLVHVSAVALADDIEPSSFLPKRLVNLVGNGSLRKTQPRNECVLAQTNEIGTFWLSRCARL